MPGVTLKPSETLESAIRRYKRVCEKTRINAEMRRREFFEKPAEERKRRFAAAVKRCRKRLTHDCATFSMNKKRKR